MSAKTNPKGNAFICFGIEPNFNTNLVTVFRIRWKDKDKYEKSRDYYTLF